MYENPSKDDPHYAEKVRIAQRFADLLNPAPVVYDNMTQDVTIEAGGACSGGACDLSRGELICRASTVLR